MCTRTGTIKMKWKWKTAGAAEVMRDLKISLKERAKRHDYDGSEDKHSLNRAASLLSPHFLEVKNRKHPCFTYFTAHTHTQNLTCPSHGWRLPPPSPQVQELIRKHQHLCITFPMHQLSSSVETTMIDQKSDRSQIIQPWPLSMIAVKRTVLRCVLNDRGRRYKPFPLLLLNALCMHRMLQSERPVASVAGQLSTVTFLLSPLQKFLANIKSPSPSPSISLALVRSVLFVPHAAATAQQLLEGRSRDVASRTTKVRHTSGCICAPFLLFSSFLSPKDNTNPYPSFRSHALAVLIMTTTPLNRVLEIN